MVLKILQREKIFWTLLPTIQKNWVGATQKNQQNYLGGKEKEAITAIRNTFSQDAENLNFVPALEIISEKESTMDQELVNCNKKYDIANYKISQVCVTIKKYNVNKTP